MIMLVGLISILLEVKAIQELTSIDLKLLLINTDTSDSSNQSPQEKHSVNLLKLI